MNKIAIIEDDIDICNMIAKFLENNKYIVHYALNGAEGIELCKSLVPDLIILDIMLPKLNGNDVLQRLRKFTNAPVIVVSAKTMVQTKIDLLKLGADDYMTKPFDLHELLARIEANLKRTSNTSCQNDTLTYRDIEINNSLVYIKEVLVSFTSTELKILRLLLQYPQKIFSKQNLYESIWNLLGFLLILILRRKPQFLRQGEVTAFYLIWYGFGRMIIEGMRTDSLMFAGLRVSQWLSMILILVGLAIILYQRRKKAPYYVEAKE